MSDDLKAAVDRIAEATRYGSAEVAAFASALAHAGETAKEALDRMAASIDEMGKIADEHTDADVLT